MRSHVSCAGARPPSWRSPCGRSRRPRAIGSWRPSSPCWRGRPGPGSLPRPAARVGGVVAPGVRATATARQFRRYLTALLAAPFHREFRRSCSSEAWSARPALETGVWGGKFHAPWRWWMPTSAVASASSVQAPASRCPAVRRPRDRRHAAGFRAIAAHDPAAAAIVHPDPAHAAGIVGAAGSCPSRPCRIGLATRGCATRVRHPSWCALAALTWMVAIGDRVA